MRRWSTLLFAGALVLLASLYLPWQEASSCGSGCFPGGRGGDVAGLRDLLAGSPTVDGWSSGVGEAAALSALLLAAAALAGLARPRLVGRLPSGTFALLAGYLGLAVAVQARAVANQHFGSLEIRLHYAYGAYLGVGGAITVLVAAGGLRRGELARYRVVARWPVLVLAAGMLVSFLLPWERYRRPVPLTFVGITFPTAIVAAALTLYLPGVWWREGANPRAARRGLSAAAALFTVAAVSSRTFPGHHAYGSWIGLGAALGLVALSFKDGTHFSRFERPGWDALAMVAGAALLVAGLFFPWQRACFATRSDLGPFSGRCFSVNGWTSVTGSAAAVLALALVVVTLAPRRPTAPTAELVAGVGLLVALLGFELQNVSGGGLRISSGYGSTVGFAGAALIVAPAALRMRPRALRWSRALIRLLPVAACTAYLVIVVLPWLDVLARPAASALRFAPPSWLTIAGVLLALRLLRLWAGEMNGASEDAGRLALLPSALLALAAVDLVRLRGNGISWGGGVVVGLCLVLILLGRVEQRGGLEKLRVPELLRVDRL